MIKDDVEICPNCFDIMDLDERFQDLVVWYCPGCGNRYSPTDLSRIVAEVRPSSYFASGSRGLLYFLVGMFVSLIISWYLWSN